VAAVADDLSAAGKKRGELLVVGTGYRAIGDLTLQAESYIRAADTVFYILGDPLSIEHILRINSNAESLLGYYGGGKSLQVSYKEMAERILEEVRKNILVCAVFYGHPGVFVAPSHIAIQQARKEGFRARMLPAVSAEDWIFADLGVDPGLVGCQSFEAADFLLRSRVYDPTSLLVLWKVGVIGMTDWSPNFNARIGARVLVDVLIRNYSSDHEVIVYEASPYMVCEPRIERVALADLPETKLTTYSTLVVPPATPRPMDRDMEKRISSRT